jgi:site-specific DNA recombinase
MLPWLSKRIHAQHSRECNVHKESGSCENGAMYDIAKVERLVIDALRLQLANPDLIKEYVKAYREDRTRVERTARKQRGKP